MAIDLNMAQFAAKAYDDAGAADSVPGYKLDADLSGRDNKVWLREGDGPGPRVVLGHRGTSSKHAAADWFNNTLSTLGLARFTARHKNAEAHLAKVIRKHGKDGLASVGHSAGGLVAGHLGSRYGIGTRAYNPHQPLLPTMNYAKAKQHIYISGKDPVSALARFFPQTRFTYVKAKGRDHHSIANFL